MAMARATAPPATRPPIMSPLLLTAPLTVLVGVAVAEVADEDTAVVE